ncbi:hypothetical protein LXL04_013196 [Taraxacum kok-saghyz]
MDFILFGVNPIAYRCVCLGVCFLGTGRSYIGCGCYGYFVFVVPSRCKDRVIICCSQFGRRQSCPYYAIGREDRVYTSYCCCTSLDHAVPNSSLEMNADHTWNYCSPLDHFAPTESDQYVVQNWNHSCLFGPFCPHNFMLVIVAAARNWIYDHFALTEMESVCCIELVPWLFLAIVPLKLHAR